MYCLSVYIAYMIISTGMCCSACCPSVCSVTHMRAGVGYYIHRDATEIQGVGSIYVLCRCLYSVYDTFDRDMLFGMLLQCIQRDIHQGRSGLLYRQRRSRDTGSGVPLCTVSLCIQCDTHQGNTPNNMNNIHMKRQTPILISLSVQCNTHYTQIPGLFCKKAL